MLHHNFPVLDPDTPSEIITEISRSPALRQYKDELIKGAQLQQAMVCLEQARINAANQRIQHRMVEGIGQKIASFGAGWWFQEILNYKGDDPWRDPDFIEDCLKKNPGLRIRYNLPAKILVNGFRRRDNGAQGDPAPASEGVDSVKAAIDTQGEVPRSAHETIIPPPIILKE